MSDERIITMQPHMAGCSQPCPACTQPLDAGQEVVVCPRCRQPQHVECWIDNGTCATRGCPQKAKLQREQERPRRTDDDRAKEYQKPLPKWLIPTLVVLVLGGIFVQARLLRDPRPTVVVLVPATEAQDPVRALTAEIAARHPDLRVEAYATPMGNDAMYYEQKLATMIIARDAPDIIMLPWVRFLEYAERGALLDLTPDIESGLAPVDRLPPHRLERGIVVDRYMGVPHPNQPLFLAIFRDTEYEEVARELLWHLVAELPVSDRVDDDVRVRDGIAIPMRIIPGM